jgi:transcriptional regulator with XRE-family HTH domain
VARLHGGIVPDERDRKEELGRFLRTRRERLTPQMVGFPHAGRRRTAGLRREEVAVLAGVSTTWYTYLEQGRDVNASPSVLASLARVLQLTDDEQRYMCFLAYGQVEPDLPADPTVPVDELLTRIVAIASDYPYPVYLVDIRCDLIAWNRAAAEWYEDWGTLPREHRNIIRWLFTSPRAKESLVNWEDETREIVARWRADAARCPGDKGFEERIAEIATLSPDFTQRWEAHNVAEHRSNARILRHPRLGVKEMQVLPVHSYYTSSALLVYHFPVD